MAENIVDSLFGMQPWQIQQQQNQSMDQQAQQMSGMDNRRLSNYLAGRAGGMLAGPVMEGMGYVNPQIEQAQRSEQVMGMGGDLTTSAGLKAKAMQFAQAGDQRTAMKLIFAAKQQEAKEQQMLIEQKKQALGERKQEFQETEAFGLKKMEAEARIAQNQQRIDDARTSAADRAALMRENNQTRMAIAQMVAASKQSANQKPMTEFQRTNFKQKIAKSLSELRGVEGAYSDLESKANELISHPGLPAATGVMGMAPSIPGGDAAKAEALIQEFKAAIKKQGLEMAREGGSIGQMTEREWPIVESMVANIDPVKLGLDGTKAQIAKAVAYAKNLTKRAQSEHSDLVSAMPEELQATAPKGKVNFGDLK